MVTFQLSVEEFRLLLEIVLAEDAPDDLANLVLMACKRPRSGVIEVPVSAEEASVLCALVRSRVASNRARTGLADLMLRQASDADRG